ncbi:MAG: Hpt domain-containing protein [Burkholderiales bacterium]|nr:Hpt domain-containing protein [Burkholderiales bacterium]
MDSQKKKKLQDSGVNVQKGLENFGGNEDLYEKYLRKFSSEPSIHELRKAVATGDKEAGQRAAHTLKGIAGQLGMESLYDKLVKMEKNFKEELKEDQASDMPDIDAEHLRLADILTLLGYHENTVKPDEASEKKNS